jgi:predicted RNA-binding Zn-ribbon protein involved in translation (DUF1610 family)
MAEIQEFKCPNCSGAVRFDSGAQKMKCPFCEAEFEVAALKEYQEALAEPAKDACDWGKAGSEWDESELDGLASNACPSCGAEIVGDRNTAATVCPYCGNTQIVRRRLEGMLKPDYVIPFKLDKKAAKTALENFYWGKKLLPDFFRAENHIDSIQGVYVPFWLFDADASARIRYRASRTLAWSDSHYNYTKTDFYTLSRAGTLGFQKIPVDGSEKMDDSYMDAIEPFDYSGITDFETPYLSGYLAEKYDVDAAASVSRAEERVKQSITGEFAKTVTGYASVTQESSAIEVKQGEAHYALFPVWMLNTKYKGRDYLFAMNGQTGKRVGALPTDEGKAWKYRASLFFGIGAAVTAIVQLALLFI